MSAAVFGGYGVFGSQVARELARLKVMVTVAGRDRARAETLAAALGPGHRWVAADATDAASCRAALAGASVAVHCAGPFSELGTALHAACLEAGVHAVDIADDRRHAAAVRSLGPRFRERGLAAVWGASSLPGLSGALATLAGGDGPPPDAARVVLFIGNDNPKGAAAVRSLVEGLGRPIAAPQGSLRGFGGRERVRLPAPFGPRHAYDFESPDYDLLPGLVGVRAVTVKVAFERALAGRVFALLARLGPRWGRTTARALARIGALFRGGSSGGAVVVDLAWPGGATRRAALVAEREGQRMAALPAALAAHALVSGAARGRGALTAAELLGAGSLVAAVTAAGFRRTSD